MLSIHIRLIQEKVQQRARLPQRGVQQQWFPLHQQTRRWVSTPMVGPGSERGAALPRCPGPGPGPGHCEATPASRLGVVTSQRSLWHVGHLHADGPTHVWESNGLLCGPVHTRMEPIPVWVCRTLESSCVWLELPQSNSLPSGQPPRKPGLPTT